MYIFNCSISNVFFYTVNMQLCVTTMPLSKSYEILGIVEGEKLNILCVMVSISVLINPALWIEERAEIRIQETNMSPDNSELTWHYFSSRIGSTT